MASKLQEVGKGAKLADSNMANYGSEEHKALLKSVAETEANWKGAGEKVGLQASLANCNIANSS